MSVDDTKRKYSLLRGLLILILILCRNLCKHGRQLFVRGM